jgi:hypothetical protein
MSGNPHAGEFPPITTIKKTWEAGMAMGDNLIKMGAINQKQLDDALAEQKKNPAERLGDVLIRLGLATREQVEKAV